MQRILSVPWSPEDNNQHEELAERAGLWKKIAKDNRLQDKYGNPMVFDARVLHPRAPALDVQHDAQVCILGHCFGDATKIYPKLLSEEQDGIHAAELTRRISDVALLPQNFGGVLKLWACESGIAAFAQQWAIAMRSKGYKCKMVAYKKSLAQPYRERPGEGFHK